MHAAATRDEALAALLTTWDTKRRTYRGPHETIDGIAILAGLNADVDELNIAAQAIRRHNHELDHRQITYDGRPRTLREWVTPDYIARQGVTLGYAMTVHKTQGTTADQTALGDPATPEEELDRVLNYLTKTLTHDPDQALIIEELNGPIEPIQPTTQPNENRDLPEWLNTHDGPAHRHRRTTGPATVRRHGEDLLNTIRETGDLAITDDHRPDEPELASLTDTELARHVAATRQTLVALLTALDSTDDDLRSRGGGRRSGRAR